MLLHQSTASNILTRALLCAVPRQTVLTCFPHSRCCQKSCTFPTHGQMIHMGSTHQQCRWYWWQRQQQDLSRVSQRHHPSIAVMGSGAAYWSTRNTISKQRYSYVTSNTDSLKQDSDKAEKDVDLEALIELEIELYRQEGFPMPSKISPREWQDLLVKGTVSSRKKYLTFLFKNEMKKLNKMKLKEKMRVQREEERQQRIENPSECEHIEYGLWRNSIFPKILDTSINHFYHCRVVQAMLFGQPLVIDLDFEKHMTAKERQNCAYQIQLMISDNRKHREPYSLEVCNAPPTLDVMARLERYVPILHKPDYPVTFNSNSYLEKYPKEQLVYLTPHCQDELTVYDHNAVYIIGGIVDKSSGEPLTFAKAKREGIQMKKLPLERYLSWGIGNKCLTLNQIINIMLDFKVTGDWSHALSHVPRRKLQPPAGSQQRKEEALLKRIKDRERNLRSF